MTKKPSKSAKPAVMKAKVKITGSPVQVKSALKGVVK